MASFDWSFAILVCSLAILEILICSLAILDWSLEILACSLAMVVIIFINSANCPAIDSCSDILNLCSILFSLTIPSLAMLQLFKIQKYSSQNTTNPMNQPRAVLCSLMSIDKLKTVIYNAEYVSNGLQI